MISDSLLRYSSQRAACKQWSTALAVVILLVAALGKLDAAKVLWAAAPLLLLGLAEAGYAAQERRLAELLKDKRGREETAILPAEAAGASVARTAVAAMSLSVWPFYLGLAAIVAAGGGTFAQSQEHAAKGIVQVTLPAGTKVGCASGGAGGCGSAAGCGTGGCGASEGKSCSCSGGAKKTAAKPAAQPAIQTQPYLQTTAGPRPLTNLPPGPTEGRAMPMRPPVNPGMINGAQFPQRISAPGQPDGNLQSPTLLRPSAVISPGRPVAPMPPTSAAAVPAPTAVVPDAPVPPGAPNPEEAGR